MWLVTKLLVTGYDFTKDWGSRGSSLARSQLFLSRRIPTIIPHHPSFHLLGWRVQNFGTIKLDLVHYTVWHSFWSAARIRIRTFPSLYTAGNYIIIPDSKHTKMKCAQAGAGVAQLAPSYIVTCRVLPQTNVYYHVHSSRDNNSAYPALNYVAAWRLPSIRNASVAVCPHPWGSAVCDEHCTEGEWTSGQSDRSVSTSQRWSCSHFAAFCLVLEGARLLVVDHDNVSDGVCMSQD